MAKRAEFGKKLLVSLDILDEEERKTPLVANEGCQNITDSSIRDEVQVCLTTEVKEMVSDLESRRRIARCYLSQRLLRWI